MILAVVNFIGVLLCIFTRCPSEQFFKIFMFYEETVFA